MCYFSLTVSILNQQSLFINSQYFSGRTEIFVLVTKYDLAEEQTVFKRQANDNNRLFPLESYEEVEKDVIREANIVGTKEHNMLRWVSYVDGSEYDNPLIDNIALKFIRHILSHQTGPAPVPPVVQGVSWLTDLRLRAKKYIEEVQRRNIAIHINTWTLAILLLCIVILLGVWKLLMFKM